MLCELIFLLFFEKSSPVKKISFLTDIEIFHQGQHYWQKNENLIGPTDFIFAMIKKDHQETRINSICSSHFESLCHLLKIKKKLFQ